MLRKGFALVGLTTGLTLASPGMAETLATDEQDLKEQVESCLELLKQIEASECGGYIMNFFRGGHINLGLASYALTLDVKDGEVLLGRFGDDNSWAPHYSISTKRSFFGGSGFGYEYSFAMDDAFGVKQILKRGEQQVSHDLGTYAAGSIYAVQANLFYSIGGNDRTPDRYFTLGLGVGLGYASAQGTTYITDNVAISNPACDAAVNAIIAGDTGQITTLQQNCEFQKFDQWGLGMSARIMLEARIKHFLMGVDLSVVNLAAAGKLVSGTKTHDISPGIISVRFDYLINI